VYGNRFADHDDEKYTNDKGVRNNGLLRIFAGKIVSPSERRVHDKGTQIQEKPEDSSGFAMNWP
jgi:hypothetical protein